ncbi:MAG: hypothetical protein ABR540_05330 [Acidimicrobiales bacterium]
MTDLETLETEIASRLHQRGAEAPAVDGWNGVQRHIHKRQQARRRRRAAGALVGLTALAGGILPLVGGGEPSRVTAGQPAGPLPRLVLDLPGYDVNRAFAFESEGLQEDPPGQLWKFSGRGLVYEGKILFVRLVPAGAPYGIGDQSPEAERFDVNGRPAFLIPYTSTVSGLGWNLDDGRMVHLVAVQLDRDQLLAAAHALDVGADGRLISDPAALPAGMTLSQEAVPAPPAPYAQSEQQYLGPSGQVDLHLQTGSPYRLLDLVLDRMASSEGAMDVSLGSAAGVLTRDMGGSGSLIWPVRPGVIAEIRATRLTVEEMIAAAKSLKQVDEPSWDELLAMAPEAPQTLSTPGAQSDALESLCRVRAEWLAATAAGDHRGQDQAVVELQSLRDAVAADGLGRDSDLLVVFDRLLRAVRSGDEAAVSATPGGGCP